MIRFTNNSLIIEIPCPEHQKPLEILHDLQTGLLDATAIIDHNDAPTERVSWTLSNIHHLLQNMLIDREQLGELHDICCTNQSGKKIFK